jgi:hypothetical protein
MISILSALVSLLSFRFRGRASLELELIALRHQVTVLRRQRPSRPKLFRADRLLWLWLYRIWPQALHVMVLVKPSSSRCRLRSARGQESYPDSLGLYRWLWGTQIVRACAAAQAQEDARFQG